MAYRLTTSQGLERVSGLVSSGSDFTVTVEFSPQSNTQGGFTRTVFAYLDALSPPATEMAGVTCAVDSQGYFLKVSGSQTGTSAIPASFPPVRVTYVRQGTTHYFYTGVLLEGTVTDDVSAITFLRAVLGNNGVGMTDVELSYYREWSAALTLNEIAIENKASTAARLADLEVDTPLLSDLNDLSGNGHHWSHVGAAGSFQDDIPASPEVIAGPFPYTRTVTVAEFNAANEFWFAFTTATAVGLSTYAVSAVNMDLTLYRSDALSVIYDTANAASLEIVGPGTYYLQLTKTAGGGIATDVAVHVNTYDATDVVPPQDAYIINDDIAGRPATAWDSTGTFLGFLSSIPAGELGAMLPNGIALWHDAFLNYHQGPLVLLDSSYQFLAGVDTTPGLDEDPDAACICANATHFYVLNVADNQLFRVTAAGVITDTGATLVSVSGADICAIGVNHAGTLCYWAEKGSPFDFHTWDIAGNVQTADLYDPGSVTSIAKTAVNGHNGEILVLADDTIVTWAYVNSPGTGITTVYHLNAAGTLLNSFPFSGAFSFLDHVAGTIDPNLVKIWFFEGVLDDSRGRFVTLDLTTGLFTEDFTKELFSEGVNLNAGSAEFIGPATSCLLIGAGPGGGGGGGGETGSLQVIKVVPSGELTAFPFTAGGGLSPDSFVLHGGEDQLFSDFPIGDGYTISETVPTGWTASYAVSNDSPIDNLLIEDGETTIVTVTNVPETPPETEELEIRWLRRAPVISDENVRLFHMMFTLDLQTGTGIASGQGSDPQVMLRYSDDSGQTWSQEHWRGSGQIGEYRRRVIWRRLGASRNRVYEIVGSDPVIVGLISAYTDVSKGAN